MGSLVDWGPDSDYETSKVYEGGIIKDMKAKSLSKMDIVYVLKDSAYNDELKYSLRSVDKYFPHRKVFFYGGKPVGFRPDEQVVVNQQGARKWDRVRNMLEMIAKNDGVSEDFVLFNDDFFVTDKVSKLPYVSDGSLSDLCIRIELANDFKPTPYTTELKRTIKAIRDKNWDIVEEKNFELHIPIVFNREKLLKVIEMFPDNRATRSLYCNYLSGQDDDPVDCWRSEKDVKIWDPTQEFAPDPDAPFVSTDDLSFAEGKVGEAIRAMFPKKCRYEK